MWIKIPNPKSEILNPCLLLAGAGKFQLPKLKIQNKKTRGAGKKEHKKEETK
jgi:hypothetical protein